MVQTIMEIKGSLPKYILAQQYNVDVRTFRNWLNHPVHLAAFERMGIKPTAHIIPPCGIKYIYETFGEP